MFQEWQRADIIATVAVAISAIALTVSLASVRFTAIQTRLAQRKALDEKAAQQPAVEVAIRSLAKVGWYQLDLTVRNRIDVAVVCETLRLRAPRGVKGYAESDEAGVIPIDLPDENDLQTEIAFEHPIQAKGARRYVGMQRTAPDDFCHFRVLISIDSASASSRRQVLEASLSVRRSNESVSFAEIMIEAKIPPVIASTVT